MDSSFPKLKVPPKPQPAQKKAKKKNAPDRPQPPWLFPSDEANPVLNPKARTDAQIMKEKQDRAKSLDYMKRRVHAAPDRPAPPPQLLTLIGIFLTDFGFNSTSRLYTNERKARQVLNGWEDHVGDKVEKGTPKLEKIYRDWYRDWTIAQRDITSSSSSAGGSDGISESGDEGASVKINGRESSDDDSEASSDGFGGSDVDLKEVPKLKKERRKAPEKTSESTSSASSSTDSDADDESDKAANPRSSARSAKTSTFLRPTVGAMINSLKRKAPTSSSESSATESESSEEDKQGPAKKTKTTVNSSATADALLLPVETEPSEATSSSSSDSEDPKVSTKPVKNTLPAVDRHPSMDDESSSTSEPDSSSSSEDEVRHTKPAGVAIPPLTSNPSDSSVTVNGDARKSFVSKSYGTASSSETSSTASSTSADDSDRPAPSKRAEVQNAASLPANTLKEKRHRGAKPTPLAELSATADSHVSNQYIPYAYADKAYKDLSVTRGKGFTKEKNKKKRGSYRGGAIDTSGGKGFKFED